MARPPRFFYNNDGSFLFRISPPMSREDFVYEAVGHLTGTQVDAVVCHMFGFGPATPLYPTEVPEARGIDFEHVDFVSVWRQQEILKGLWAKGQDPWKQAVEAAHSAGMEYWAGMRFNDVHGERFGWPNAFSVNHPEYALGERRSSPEGRLGKAYEGLNFAIPEVQAHRLALAEEVCTRYDVDGFEWDFLREPGHHFPDIESGRSILTDYMHEARNVLQRSGEHRGRPLGFGIRVPGTPEKCLQIGLEVETWIREGLVDYVSPSPYWDAATELPFEPFLAMAEGTDCRIYACTSEAVGPGHHSFPPASTLRAGIANAWRQGVDGIYAFNFHHYARESIDESTLLHQLGSPSTLEFQDKLFVISGGHRRQEIPAFDGFEHQLPLVLKEQPAGPGNTLRFLVSDDLESGAERGTLEAVTLELIVLGLTPEDVFETRLNGKALSGTPSLQPLHHTVWPGPNANQGNYVRRYDLGGPEWIKQGWNEVEFALRRRNPKLRACDFVVHDLSLEIKYRILPMRG